MTPCENSGTLRHSSLGRASAHGFTDTPHRRRNSRKLEAQADVEGMKALTRAGIPVEGMAGMFQRLQSEEVRIGDGTPGLLSSQADLPGVVR